jgi:hypothetical protein
MEWSSILRRVALRVLIAPITAPTVRPVGCPASGRGGSALRRPSIVSASAVSGSRNPEYRTDMSFGARQVTYTITEVRAEREAITTTAPPCRYPAKTRTTNRSKIEREILQFPPASKQINHIISFSKIRTPGTRPHAASVVEPGWSLRYIESI